MPLPAVVLVVSGGHTSLYRVPTPGAYELLGRTRDDAAGEAYDKVAKLLGLGYPGGPVIDRLAAQGERPRRAVSEDAADARRSQRAAPAGPPRLQLQRPEDVGAAPRDARRAALGLAADEPLPDGEIDDICASFQRVVVETLLDRLFDAARWYGARSVGIAGGVSANSRLRADARGARRGARAAGVRPEPRAVDRQCGDDCRRRAAAHSRRRDAARAHAGPATLQMQIALPLCRLIRQLMIMTHHRLSLVQHQEAAGVRPHHRRGRRDREEERRAGRDGARLGDAHHGRRLRERLGERADSRLPGVAREAGAGGARLPASSDRRRQRRRAPEAHAHGPPGHPADHRRASSISARGSRCSTPSSTASAGSASSSR